MKKLLFILTVMAFNLQASEDRSYCFKKIFENLKNVNESTPDKDKEYVQCLKENPDSTRFVKNNHNFKELSYGSFNSEITCYKKTKSDCIFWNKEEYSCRASERGLGYNYFTAEQSLSIYAALKKLDTLKYVSEKEEKIAKETKAQAEKIAQEDAFFSMIYGSDNKKSQE